MPRKRVLFEAAILAGAAFLGYREYQRSRPPSPAYQAYERFAKLCHNGDFREAERLAAGPARKALQPRLEAIRRWEKILPPHPPSRQVESAGVDLNPRVTYSFQKESEKALADDRAIVSAVMTVSVSYLYEWAKLPAPAAGGFRHLAELHRDGGIWKVYSLEEERIAPAGPRSR